MVKLYWYTLGTNNGNTSAITVSGATPATVQLNWGPANKVFQTVTADGSGDIAGVFNSTSGTLIGLDQPVAGLQIHVAP